jgi:hypothetical protein
LANAARGERSEAAPVKQAPLQSRIIPFADEAIEQRNSRVVQRQEPSLKSTGRKQKKEQ